MADELNFVERTLDELLLGPTDELLDVVNTGAAVVIHAVFTQVHALLSLELDPEQSENREDTDAALLP